MTLRGRNQKCKNGSLIPDFRQNTASVTSEGQYDNREKGGDLKLLQLRL